MYQNPAEWSEMTLGQDTHRFEILLNLITNKNVVSAPVKPAVNCTTYASPQSGHGTVLFTHKPKNLTIAHFLI